MKKDKDIEETKDSCSNGQEMPEFDDEPEESSVDSENFNGPVCTRLMTTAQAARFLNISQSTLKCMRIYGISCTAVN